MKVLWRPESHHIFWQSMNPCFNWCSKRREYKMTHLLPSTVRKAQDQINFIKWRNKQYLVCKGTQEYILVTGFVSFLVQTVLSLITLVWQLQPRHILIILFGPSKIPQFIFQNRIKSRFRTLVLTKIYWNVTMSFY